MAFRRPDRVRPDDGLHDASDEPPDGGRGTWVSLNYSASASSSGEASSRDHAERQQHAFAGEAGDAGRGSRIGANLTKGRGDGRPRHRG